MKKTFFAGEFGESYLPVHPQFFIRSVLSATLFVVKAPFYLKQIIKISIRLANMHGKV
jgi:hypothetical protein